MRFNFRHLWISFPLMSCCFFSHAQSPSDLRGKMLAPTVEPLQPALDFKGVPVVPQSPVTQQGPVIPEKALEILDFWFGSLENPHYFPVDKISTWFGGASDIDAEIRNRYSQDVLKAARGEYNAWRESPRGRLALVLLLDQFPRRIYHNQPQAFMTDPMARALVLEGMQLGDDQRLLPIERAFFYLPLEHAEDLRLQGIAVDAYQRLLAQSPTSMKPVLQDFLFFAKLHQQQIARFGRFPHRNAILGRPSTPEEVVFLNQWGKNSF